jgi:methyl-accepting chemotaxis protein
LKLQKLQTAAPLIGVLLTAIGFVSMESDLNDLQSLAVPLVGGVATGAILALLSQFILYFVELDIEKSRQDGQLLIDCIWIKATEAMEDPHKSVLLAVGRLELATSSLTKAIGSFPDNVPALTRKFSEIHDISKSTFASLAEIGPLLKTTSADWRAASLVLKESTERELIPSHKHLFEGAKQLHSVISELSTIAVQLQNTCSSIGSACQEQQYLHAAMVSSAKEQSDLYTSNLANQVRDFQESHKFLVGDTLEMMNAVLNELCLTVTNHLSAIQAGTEEIKEPLKETAAYLAAAAPSLQSSSDILSVIGKAAQDFSETVSQTILPSYQNLKLFEALAQEMQVSVGRLSESLNDVSIASKAGQELSEVIKRRALPTVEVLQRATGSFEDSVNLLAECTRELSSVLDLLVRVNNIENAVRVVRPNE